MRLLHQAVVLWTSTPETFVEMRTVDCKCSESEPSFNSHGCGLAKLALSVSSGGAGEGAASHGRLSAGICGQAATNRRSPFDQAALGKSSTISGRRTVPWERVAIGTQ